MDLEYDSKFEEMKKYIPFLERMIKRLESTGTVSNPRQAQLDKIRSLRDLLLDKKKRMKMENLLKCEQVLVNLHAKVEQKETLPESKKDPSVNNQNEKPDLNTVRKKLKSAVTKLQTEPEETLPEIARASAIEEICVPGSKEPALFQRRPNMSSTDSAKFSPTRTKESKRNYTRVLLSPETSQRRWADNENLTENQLFCRRSPKKSPRRISPTYYKKEKKKSKNKSKSLKSKNLNITLNVPEDSLSSLNTKDILSRIINCSDGDVDIDTLRVLRKQILGELKNTGTKDDISDILLKSYKKRNTKGLKMEEVEEGEISDSESEAIESIYGSLVIMDKDKSTSEVVLKASDVEKPRKIQICLVINPDKSKGTSQQQNCKSIPIDISDLETFEKNANENELVKEDEITTRQDLNNSNDIDSSKVNTDVDKSENDVFDIKNKSEQSEIEENIHKPENVIHLKNCDAVSKETTSTVLEENVKPNFYTCNEEHEDKSSEDKVTSDKDTLPDEKNMISTKKNCNSTLDPDNVISNKKITSTLNESLLNPSKKMGTELNTLNDNLKSGSLDSCDKQQNLDTDIPLLGPTNSTDMPLEPTKKVSEIDILQALKKEILSETTCALNSESITPPLHQPKVTKVVNAQEIGTKKRISIESYKAKAYPSSKSVTNNDYISNLTKDDVAKKQSIKLTEKEFERFNLSKVRFDDSSDDDKGSHMSLDDIYSDLAPKSPDHDDFADTGLKPPVIIPSDPVKTAIVSSEADIDMRKLLPMLQINSMMPNSSTLPSVCKENLPNTCTEKEVPKNDKQLQDPRKKRETSCVTECPNPYRSNSENTPISGINYANSSLNSSKFSNLSTNSTSISKPNSTPTRVSMISPNLTTNVSPHISNLNPSMTPNRTPNITPSMTPNARKYEMTPSRQTFDNDEFAPTKHVYTPIFLPSESRDCNENQRHKWDKSPADQNQKIREDIDARSSSVQRDIDYRDPRSNSFINRDNQFDQYQKGSINDRFLSDNRMDCPLTPSHPFGRLDCPPTPNPSFGRMDCVNSPNNLFGRTDPNTPTPSFGRMDCPSTPTASFGRMDCPMTPVPSFVNAECPPTPNHPFSRSDCPSTPNHPFGRSDCPSTPNHPFGRSDCPSTPNHPFGRSDCPSTPNHPFGRPEPLLKTQFIRPDFCHTSSNHNYVKPQDPRLNRVTEYDNCYTRDDEREMGYFQDRNFNTDSYKPEFNNRRNNTDQFRNFQREQSVGRNDRSNNFEKSTRNYRDSNRDSYAGRSFNRESDHNNRDSNIGRFYNRDYDSERTNSKNRGYSGRSHDYRHQNEYKKYDDHEKRQFQREKSVNRKESSGETFSRSEIRDSSEGRIFRKENNFSIKHQAGHSFTIDTSINRTFQLNDYNDISARRQRAASVGRTLVPDSRRDVINKNRNSLVIKNIEDNKSKFRRACSVGREIKNNKLDFKETKEDLKSFKFKGNISLSKQQRNVANEVTALKNYQPRSRKEIHDSSKSAQSNIKYSPKKNSRDPRMRREYESKDKFRDKDYRSNSYERKNYGIVYSNDNISKGNIMGPGYGVKNYKIPKIKRLQEDSNECIDDKTAVVSIDTNLKNEDKKNVDVKNEQLSVSQAQKEGIASSYHQDISNLTKNEPLSSHSSSVNVPEKKEVKVQQDTNKNEDFNENSNNESQSMEDQIANTANETSSLEISDKRMTRSVAKNMSYESFEELDTSPVKRTRRVKKPVVIDSESDDNDLNEFIPKSLVDRRQNQELISTIKPFQQTSLDSVNNITETYLNNDKSVTLSDRYVDKKIDTQKITSPNNFIDELEIFTDNVISDPVVDNINDLIADLDHDLESSAKAQDDSNFTKELNLETMLENITSPEECDHKDESSDEIGSLVQKKTDLINTQAQNIEKNNKESTNQSPAISPNNSNLGEMASEDNSKVCTKDSKILEQNISEDVEKEPYEVSNLDIVDTRSNEPIVSTSGDCDRQESETKLVNKVCDAELNGQSTPDSTIGSNETDENVGSLKRLPDSTNDMQCEMHADISSTHSTTEVVNFDKLQPTSSNKAADQIETFGKLLSMLQDKSKIKELLGLLGNQSSENDKIKKKLEKLSEIVSDDEDTVEYSGTMEKNSECEPGIKNANVEFNKNEKSLPDEQNQGTNTNANALETLEKHYSIDENTIQKEEILNQKKEEPVTDDSTPKENQSNENSSITNTKSVLAITNESVNEIKAVSIDKLDEQFISSKEVNNEELKLDNALKIPSVDPPAVVNDGLVKHFMEEEIPSGGETNKSTHTELLEEAEKTSKKLIKPGCSKRGRRKNIIRSIPLEQKRITRSDVANLRFEKSARKKPTELQKLQDDIREMFIKDDILNTTGIRMCRLAKLVDDKKNEKDEQTPADNCVSGQSVNQGPIVVLEKFNDLNTADEISTNTSAKKRVAKGKRIKGKSDENSLQLDTEDRNASLQLISNTHIKSVLKAKTKLKEQNEFNDPYAFETDSMNRSENTSNLENDIERDESESESLGSSKSFGSTELLTEVKKKIRRKRSAWKSGIIKRISKKKKSVNSQTTIEKPCESFTDKTYCFYKNKSNYNCRLCSYSGLEIVNHYKKQHPHSEIPLSRLSCTMAKVAIKESKRTCFQTLSKIPSKKYVCRFCLEEIGNKKPVLEAFFWHVVSMHTGEYKQICSECVNISRCPFNLDIPPPPKESKGQLLGYICEKCNYTQISLENLKSHVILRHNDEQTAVYTINLAVMSKKSVVADNIQKSRNKDKHTNSFESDTRLLRSSRSNQSYAESSDVISDSTEESCQNAKTTLKENEDEPNNEGNFKIGIQSKITFENDNIIELSNYDDDTCNIKIEQELNEYQADSYIDHEKQLPDGKQIEESDNLSDMGIVRGETASNDVFDYPHFKIKYTETGAKEYICCINGNDLHYKTTLLISLKKHVQLKHSEKWDGYCYACKVIVTPQGIHHFKDCLQHLLDNHNNFPVLEETTEENVPNVESNISDNVSNDTSTTSLSYINVRPLSDLISKNIPASQSNTESSSVLSIIENIVSLGSEIEQSRPSPTYPSTEHVNIKKQYRYEEVQAETMLKKHRVVLDAMMSSTKLIQVFKCAGRFCSFTTDSAEDALLHASTHMRVGGENSLNCVYCDYDASNNAVDLITHVFKTHGRCPYVCSLCFYRAATAQLVDAHIKRVHENATNKQILHTAFQTGPITDEDILSRADAVQFYQCMGGIGTDAECKFRTYTPGKFSEHLKMKHISDKEFTCCVCSSILTTPSDLVSHIKTHGLKLYQCVWCIYGSDNEAGLLAHSSSLHPDKIPKAYLRIITNKEGTNERRVLPLAPLNKLEISSVEVSPMNFKENPVTVAERSTELEKLISQTAFMIESTVVEESVPISNLESDIQTTMSEVLSLAKSSESTTNISASPRRSEEINTLETKDVKPVINEAPKPAPEVVCLDSDEEDSNTQNVIDLSDDVSTSSQNVVNQNQHAGEIKTLPLTELFLCSKCKMTFKMGSGLKKHVLACFGSATANVPCAHCPITLKMKELLHHYTRMHSERALKRFSCSQCSVKLHSLAQLREHVKSEHTPAPAAVQVQNVSANAKNKPGPKRRKRSLGSKDKAIEPPKKVKKFGPQDIHLLPINPILDELVFCSLCEFSTKVRHNLVRHLQLHAEQQPVAQTAPVNPVPHLESNEKHFDKMVNLASSSILPRTDKSKPDSVPSTMIPFEAASRYPKHVPEKHRLTCGAKGCSYISVDESMLKRHWEALHTGTNSFHCVHCPPYQHLDTTKPLTASRIIGHLKMHDTNLYACSVCPYYHYRRQILEHHLAEVHKSGQVMIVREEKSVPATAAPHPPPSSAPTMDLKPWQCGLCKYKSLLRQEIVEHCAKVHNSKMQYRCAYCAFRTSNTENITKHQSKSHSGKDEEIFYFYYQEGSVPEESDGTPRWQKQSQKITTESKIKSEPEPSETLVLPTITQVVSIPQTPPNQDIDLNLVKKEAIETNMESTESLCKEFGEFCEPNGLKYKCSLCKLVIEDTAEAMQSHLYEELKYRKWGCSICSYKAFHKAGLNEHMQIEHRQNRDPVALKIDVRIESWVAKLLEHQTALIAKNKENLVKQKEEIFRPVPGTSTKPQVPLETPITSKKLTMTELEKTFGSFGNPVNMSFCCPKCKVLFKEEGAMQNHLESELSKIRWFCSECFVTFQTYHEAQFHCRSSHSGTFPRPVEVVRDASVRSSWVQAVIRVQKLSMNYVPLQKHIVPDPEPDVCDNESDNSLLVVRYEEQVPTPEHHMAASARAASPDSDDEKLVIAEPKQPKRPKSCPICNYRSPNVTVVHHHILRHYELKPAMCGICGANSTKRAIEMHHKNKHPGKPLSLFDVQVPDESPEEYLAKQPIAKGGKVICLVCRSMFSEGETKQHTHNNMIPAFGKKNDVVAKCAICLTLHKDVDAYYIHHNQFHEQVPKNYVFTKLNTIDNESKEIVYACGICTYKFGNMAELKTHVNSLHGGCLLYSVVPKYQSQTSNEILQNEPPDTQNQVIDVDAIGVKRKSVDVVSQPFKRVAKKSTTKLPLFKTCARKSTTKLPFDVPSESEEFSYYGTRPNGEGLESVTAMMPFCNAMVPFTLQKLNEIININPIVKVRKEC